MTSAASSTASFFAIQRVTNACSITLNVKPDSWCRTSLERPSLHPEFGEGGPGVVKRRVRHRSSAVGRPAGTGARSHWSSGTQREEGAGWRERAGGEWWREGSQETERERVRGYRIRAGWGLPLKTLQQRQRMEEIGRKKEVYNTERLALNTLNNLNQ